MSTDIREIKVPITLDKERTLIFDLNAFIELEEIYGTYKAALAALSTQSLKAIRAFLWAGLVHEDKTLTVEKVGSLITGLDPAIVTDLADKILQSTSGNLPTAKN